MSMFLGRDTEGGYRDRHQARYVRQVLVDDTVEVVESHSLCRPWSSVRTVPRFEVQKRLRVHGAGFSLIKKTTIR